MLEAGERAVWSWPSYYDSLTLFSPARYSTLAGAAFPRAPRRYPTRDEVVAYLERYAAALGAEIHLDTKVKAVDTAGKVSWSALREVSQWRRRR